jgi:multidrug resistance efflux pump
LPTQEKPQNGKKRWLIFALPIVIASAYFTIWPSAEVENNIASHAVEQGEFVVSLNLKGGELEAIKAENIVAPRVRGQLKITELFPEGETVEIGDLLVQFEPTEFEKRLMDREQQLEQARAELEKTIATQKAEISGLEAAIENQKADLRLAELQVDRMVFESTLEKERAQIQARKAQLSYEQAVEKLATQKVINAADIKKRELDTQRKERDLDQAQKEIEKITIKAEKPGLVVYGKVWKGSGPEKIRVGDEIWGGVNIITLPDLSRMQVKTYVNEVDVDKLKIGQPASIKLDALPEPTFNGKIASIAPLGREKEGEKHVKVFDVTVEIAEEDDRLKPGMTAIAEVIIETIPPRPEIAADSVLTKATDEVVAESLPLPLFIPLDAVFEKDGRTVVYRLVDGQPKEVEVVLGKRNNDYVVVEEGLVPDDRVTLRDPTITTVDISGTDAGEGSSTPQVQ